MKADSGGGPVNRTRTLGAVLRGRGESRRRRSRKKVKDGCGEQGGLDCLGASQGPPRQYMKVVGTDVHTRAAAGYETQHGHEYMHDVEASTRAIIPMVGV